MPSKKYSKEQIIQTLQNLASQLDKQTLSKAEIGKVIPTSTVNRRFGSVGNALEAAGLRRISSSDHLKNRGNVLSDDDLFKSLYGVEISLGKEPTYNEYSARGKYSIGPFKRFGLWEETLSHYRKWKKDSISAGGNFPVVISEQKPKANINNDNKISFDSSSAPAPKDLSQSYGEPINFRSLRYAPTNEQGVVFLFGIVSEELGFTIELLREAFPDCEAMYCHDKKKKLYRRVRIEFEFNASNFKTHGHDHNHCDFVVCWENDWPESPIRVIELKKEILKLSPKG